MKKLQSINAFEVLNANQMKRVIGGVTDSSETLGGECTGGGSIELPPTSSGVVVIKHYTEDCDYGDYVDYLNVTYTTK